MIDGKQPRILITGATGFVGSHLVNALSTKGYTEIWGWHQTRPLPRQLPLDPQRYVQGDLLDTADIDRILMEVHPDWIFHLAGQAEVARSWTHPHETFTNNVLGQLNLLELLRKHRLTPRVLVAGSSEEYGAVRTGDLPVHEETPFRPVSPYAVSKVAQDLMAFQYFRSYNLPILTTRAFNHTGPGRPDQYAISNFAKQIASIEAGLSLPVLHVGNLEAQRDYLDVRDVAHAYVLALEKGEPGEAYNICSGRPLSMRHILDQLLELTRVSIATEVDPARLRPSDLPMVYGNCSKFRKLTAWEPVIPFKQTLRDLLDYWRDNVKPSVKQQARIP